MGVLSAIMERRASDVHPSSPSGWLLDLVGGGATKSGVRLNEWQVLNLSTVWCCASSIAIDIASMPFHVYRRIDATSREKDTSHPAWYLIEVEPNPEMDALSFWDTLQWRTLQWGNGLAEIERKKNGDPKYLWPMDPWRTDVERAANGQLVYRYTPANGPTKMIPGEDVLHLKGMGNGLMGMNVIRYARESMGAAMAADDYSARFFGQSANAGGFIKHPKPLGPTAMKNLRESWEAQHKGVDNAHRVAILEEGAEFVRTTIPPDEAQLLMTRERSVSEICRWYRFPPHMAMDLSRATFSNIEQQDLSYVGYTLYGWVRRQEKEVLRKLVLPSERRKYFAERMIDSKIRTDLKARYEAHALAKQNGWLNADEIREMENRNPIPDGSGKMYTVQVNMAPSDQLGNDAAAAPDPAADPTPDPAATKKTKTADGKKIKIRSAERIVSAQRELLQATYARILRVEADKVRRAGAKPGFDAWRVEFYVRHLDVVKGELFPLAESIVECVRVAFEVEIPASSEGSARAIVDTLANLHVGASIMALGVAAPKEATLTAWESTRAEAQACEHLRIVADLVAKAWPDKEP